MPREATILALKFQRLGFYRLNYGAPCAPLHAERYISVAVVVPRRAGRRGSWSYELFIPKGSEPCQLLC